MWDVSNFTKCRLPAHACVDANNCLCAERHSIAEDVVEGALHETLMQA